MELTEGHLRVAFAAWTACRSGGGIAVDGDHFVEAHQLAERGWLKRKFVDGELAWFWTRQAETALHLSQLTSVEGREN